MIIFLCFCSGLDKVLDKKVISLTDLPYRGNYRGFVVGFYYYLMVSTSKVQCTIDAVFCEVFTLWSICGSGYPSSKVNLFIVCE